MLQDYGGKNINGGDCGGDVVVMILKVGMLIMVFVVVVLMVMV